MKIRPIITAFQHFLNRVLLFSGILFLLAILVSFTSLPYWGIHWLGTSKSKLKEKPEFVVFLGGGGMPSESNLMRAYYTAHVARLFPESRVIISIPGDTSKAESTCRKIASEIALHGISSERICFEPTGTNTRAQALALQTFQDQELLKRPILLVTSPEHMRRAVLTFQKAGFTKISALPAFEDTLEANLQFSDKNLGGNKLLIPEVGNNITIRYQFWNHLKYEILFLRELTALAYYGLRGWI